MCQSYTSFYSSVHNEQRTRINAMTAGGVSNVYLYNTLKNSMKCSNLFVGVFSSDNMNLEELKRRDEFILICNLSPQWHSGSHFVTIVANTNEIIYCDSLALPISTSQSLFANLKHIGIGRRLTSLLKRPIQAPLSEFCGLYCIYCVCLFDYQRFPIVNDQKKFATNDLRQNDLICVQNIKQMIQSNPLIGSTSRTRETGEPISRLNH